MTERNSVPWLTGLLTSTGDQRCLFRIGTCPQSLRVVSKSKWKFFNISFEGHVRYSQFPRQKFQSLARNFEVGNLWIFTRITSSREDILLPTDLNPYAGGRMAQHAGRGVKIGHIPIIRFTFLGCGCTRVV